MPEKATQVDVRDVIMEHLEKIERDLAWMSRKLDIPYATLYSTFVQKLIKLSPDKLKKVNKLLKTDYTAE